MVTLDGGDGRGSSVVSRIRRLLEDHRDELESPDEATRASVVLREALRRPTVDDDFDEIESRLERLRYSCPDFSTEVEIGPLVRPAQRLLTRRRPWGNGHGGDGRGDSAVEFPSSRGVVE